jgi:pyruvate/2-oxoglutarate dehydrogenase complex dihydrolipoamide acyltransferase (E2) component
MFESELEQQKEQVKRKRKTLEQQLEEAKAKEAAELKRLDQAKEKRKQLEQRQKKQLSETERKNDTRRKIIAGAFLLKKFNEDPLLKDRLLRELKDYVALSERKDDAQLFENL